MSPLHAFSLNRSGLFTERETPSGGTPEISGSLGPTGYSGTVKGFTMEKLALLVITGFQCWFLYLSGANIAIIADNTAAATVAIAANTGALSAVVSEQAKLVTQNQVLQAQLDETNRRLSRIEYECEIRSTEARPWDTHP